MPQGRSSGLGACHGRALGRLLGAWGRDMAIAPTAQNVFRTVT